MFVARTHIPRARRDDNEQYYIITCTTRYRASQFLQTEYTIIEWNFPNKDAADDKTVDRFVTRISH